MGQQKEEWKIFKNVFDQFTLQILQKLEGQGHFDELKSPIALGKEANIFTAKKGEDTIIAKIYRLENCNFNQMFRYLQPDPRFNGLKKRRRLIIFSWVQREYRNLLKAREVVRVPKPIAIKDNVLLMEFIGKNDEPAPQLKNAPPEKPQEFFDKIVKGLKALYKVELVHADLSEFNILNFEEEPVFIDLSQMTTTEHPHADEYMMRDLNNICRYFRKQGVKAEADVVFKQVTGKSPPL